MRMSIRADDPGYENYQRYGRSTVFLGGKEVRFCITADEEEGMVVRYKTYSDSSLMVANGEIQQETLKGKVKIVPTL